MAKGSKILTRANMSKLKPGGVLRENGIEYHNKVREGGTWYINAMVDGQRIHRKIGKNGRSGQPGEYTLTALSGHSGLMSFQVFTPPDAE